MKPNLMHVTYQTQKTSNVGTNRHSNLQFQNIGPKSKVQSRGFNRFESNGRLKQFQVSRTEIFSFLSFLYALIIDEFDNVSSMKV